MNTYLQTTLFSTFKNYTEYVNIKLYYIRETKKLSYLIFKMYKESQINDYGIIKSSLEKITAKVCKFSYKERLEYFIKPLY